MSSSSTQTNESTQVDLPSPPTAVFKLRPPVKCLVAYATATGHISQGDNVGGGFWTHTLCEKLKELTTILDQTHEVVLRSLKGNNYLTINHVLVQSI